MIELCSTSDCRPAFENALPCPALIVASEDDPYASLDYARRLAVHWRASFVNLGCKGHINAASNLDDWQQGLQLLHDFEFRLANEGATIPSKTPRPRSPSPLAERGKRQQGER